MNLIGRQELKETLDREEDTKLVMVLGEWAYRAKLIPGFLRIDTLEEALEMLDPNDEVAVYDSNPRCVARLQAYRGLKTKGRGTPALPHALTEDMPLGRCALDSGHDTLL